MTAYDALYLTGTFGYIAFIVLALAVVRRWRHERGIAWLTGTAGLLAIAVMAAAGGFLFIALIRALAQSEWIITANDARIVAGAAPWMAFIFLAGHKWPKSERR